jgi:hypothetical protein
MGRGFGLVVRAAGWHVGDLRSILGRDSLYTFGCIPQRFESVSADILRYIKPLILFYVACFVDPHALSLRLYNVCNSQHRLSLTVIMTLSHNFLAPCMERCETESYACGM